jgi:hypothetical protein
MFLTQERKFRAHTRLGGEAPIRTWNSCQLHWVAESASPFSAASDSVLPYTINGDARAVLQPTQTNLATRPLCDKKAA